MIIRELEAIFPPANNSYVFGPVVKIGWGTPPIIEAELGVVISFGPDGVIIAVLGSITAILPRPRTGTHRAAARLRRGDRHRARARLWFDASLHDSHIVGFALAGDMALRASFSDSRSFLFSVGGFHPAFTPPDGFPELDRMSLGISVGGVIEISFTCYFAVTSNTVQFGAALDIWAKVSGFEIAGGVSFDALIRFSPFELNTNIGLYVSVSAVGVDLMGVWLNASLTGPSPWHVIGTAEFKVVGITKNIRVDKVLGTRVPQPPAPVAPDLLALLAEELSRAENWSVVASSASGVTLAEPSALAGAAPAPSAASGEGVAATLRARPDSIINIAQKVLPLGVTLDKFRNTGLGRYNDFGIVASGGLTSDGVVSEWFAPSDYFQYGPKERLSQPSFLEFDAGISFGSSAVQVGVGVRLPDDHYEHVIDPEFVGLAPPPRSAVRPPLKVTELTMTRNNPFLVAARAYPEYVTVTANSKLGNVELLS